MNDNPMDELIEAWDRASEPNELGQHNGGGFALHNWEQIREILTSLNETTWEYGTALRTPEGLLWDFEFEGTRENAEWHVRACAKDGHDHGMDVCVIVRRRPRVSAGEWTLLEAGDS